MPAPPPLHPLPTDATLTVTRAAQVLGVHANTVRTWSEAGRLRYYRINKRGDRRYRLSDLHRFLSAAVSGPTPGADSNGRGSRTRRELGRLDRQSPTESLDGPGDVASTVKALTTLGRLTFGTAGSTADPEMLLGSATRIIREASSFSHVSAWRLVGGHLEPVAVSGSMGLRPDSVAADRGLVGQALKRPGQVVDDDPAAGRAD
ncbi:MAG: helix-turn-helix domain-containing protein, partial [Chloroflexota bacterium]